MPKDISTSYARFCVLGLAAGLCTALGGCSSFLSEGTGAAAGIAGATLANQITDNAAAATGIGLGVQAAAQAGLQYAERQAHAKEQDAIARAASHLGVGGVASWSVKHAIPIEGDESGRVTVSRLIGGAGLHCKEIVFSVDADKPKTPEPARQFYVTTICNDGNHWRWASAEPATSRWGSLQ